MSSRMPDTHAEAWALLPWLANGRIAPEDREWVEAHLQGCDECRAELAGQRLVASQVNRDAAAIQQPGSSDEQRSFNKLWARIEAAESVSQVATGTSGAPVLPRSSRTIRWLAAAVVVQAIGLGLFGFALNKNHNTGDGSKYETVTTPESRLKAPAVSVVFAPQASMANINTLLAHQGLSIVAGPGASNNFKAELSPDAVASGASAETVAAVMSKDPNVIFAEPISQAPAAF